MLKNISIRHLIPLLLLGGALVFVVFFYSISLPAAMVQAQRLGHQQTRSLLQAQQGRFSELLSRKETLLLGKELYYANTAPSTYRIFILDEDNIIRHATRSRTLNTHISTINLPIDEQLINAASDERRIFIGEPAADHHYVAGYAALNFVRNGENESWRLVIVRDHMQTTEAILRIAAYPAEMLATFLLLVSIAAMVVLRRHLNQRIQPLLQTATRISRGERNVRTEMDGADEFSDIASSLDQMASRVDAQRLELENAKANAEKANIAKNYFLHHMSHEIQTPLTALLGFLDLMKETELDSDASLYLRTMETSARTLSNLINDLLETSRLEAGTVTPVLQAFCLNTVIQDLLDSLLPRVREKGLTLRIRCSDSDPIWIDSDPRIFRQILVNLIGNAIQYTEHGTIDISIDSTLFGADETELSLTIKDTGIGISEKDLPHIFERFYRSNEPKVVCQKGAGIGLTVCSDFARLINGTLDVKSTFGIGSSFNFRVSVPLSAAEEDFDFAALSLKEQGSLSILLVEHTPVTQLLLKSILEKAGHRVETSNNGESAIKYMKRRLIYPHLEQASLILMDLHMPGMDGFQTIEEIRGLDSRYLKTPFIGTSTQDDPLTRDKCIAAGFDGFIAKPIDRRSLTEEIFRLSSISNAMSAEEAALQGSSTDIDEAV